MTKIRDGHTFPPTHTHTSENTGVVVLQSPDPFALSTDWDRAMPDTNSSSPQTENGTPSMASPAPSATSTATPSAPGGANNNKKKKQNSQTGKKVSADILERRRAGRLKAAETMARKIKKSGIERRDNPLKYSVFEQLNLINQKNYFTDYLKKDDQAFILRERRQLRLSKQKASSNNTNDSKDLTKKLESTPLGNDEDDDDVDIEDEEDIEEENDNINNENENDADNENENAGDGIEKRLRKRHGSDIVVIHPGSKNLRIGLASDIYPKTVPFVIATPGKLKTPPYTDIQPTEEQEDRYDKGKDILQRDFKERMKYYKRRIIPNSNDVVINFNKKVEPTTISEINDIHKLEYIKPDPSNPKSYYIGDDALRIDSNDYKLRYPLITNGKFNLKEYDSLEEMIGEIELVITKTLQDNYKISNLKNFKTVLVVPDLYDKFYIETFIKLLLQLGFQGISIIQESLAATYGAGVTQACVIDIGAQTTKISCIDDGMIIPNSRALLNYGGDDITRYFYKLLRQSSFPIEFNESVGHEWVMMEQLKEKFITFQDANVTVQLYNFIKRYPDKLSESYEFKVFDEVMLAPMALFCPDVFQKPANFENTEICDIRSKDVFVDEFNDPISTTQKNSLLRDLYSNKQDFDILKDLLNNELFETGADTNLPTLSELDKMVIQSIANGSRYDFSKAKTFYENLLIVGGSSKIESLDFILTDRINIWRPKILSYLQFFDFFKKAELIIANFEKKHELSKLPPDAENLKQLQDELDQQLESELDQYLASASNTLINIEVLPAPREIDPSILTWKGGSVFARLKIMEELWITERDWNLLGSRTLQHKLLFSY